MKRKLLYLFVVLAMVMGFFPGTVPALATPAAMPILATPAAAITPPPATQWTKTFGGTNDDYGLSVQPTADGGYIIGGQTSSFGAGLSDVYLIKTDASGNVTWSKTIGGSNYDEGLSVRQTADGGYITAGNTRSFGAGDVDVYLVKTDASGNVTWQKTFGGGPPDNGYSVMQTADGGYIVSGTTESFGAGSYDFYLVKTDASGNMTWQKTFGGAGYDRSDSVQQTADGGYIVSGFTASFGAGARDVYLVKTDASGNMTWSQTFGGTNDDYGWSVRQTSDGGYIIVGATLSFGPVYSDVYLIKTNASGNMTWSQTFGGTGYDNGYSVQPTTDGGYIISGDSYSFDTGSSNVSLIKTDSSGNMTWSQTFGGIGDDVGYSIQPTADGGYIIAGFTWAPGTGTDVYLIKVAAPLAEQKPDLRVTEKHEVWVVPGVSYRVFFTIQNTGNASAPAGHDTVLQVDGQFLEFKPVPVSLAPGENYTDNFTTIINLSGSYDNVNVTADFNNEVDESNEGNNRASPSTIAWPAAPDLSISNKYESWIQPGTQYTVNFTIRNQGNSPAPAGHDVELIVDGASMETKPIPVILNPGQSYTDVFGFVSTITGGVDKVKVTADINIEVAESREDNNFYENTIAWPQAPDLVINSKFEQWLPGSTTQYNVYFGIRNIGNAPAPAGFWVELKVDGIVQGEMLIPVILNQGSIYNGIFSTNVTISGSDNITVTADINNEVAESDETNNLRWNTWSAPPPPAKPDLSILEKHEVWEQEGVSYRVFFTVKNNGGATAPAGHDTALQVDGQLLESKPVPVSLAPGDNYTDNFTSVVYLSGSHDSVTVVTDFNTAVNESNETNNRRGNTFAWPAAPDLSISNKYEEWAVQGTQYTVNFTVRNSGNAPAPAGYDVELMVDNASMETKPVPVILNPGESYTDAFGIVLSLTGGMDKVKVTADINNTVIESREDNNAYENTIAWPQAPDLIVSGKNEQWLPGSTTQYNVFFGVRNIGNAPAPAGFTTQLMVDGTPIENVTIPVILNQGSTYNGAFYTPITLSDNSDNVTVIADISNEVAESDETNNSRSNTWSAPAKPDLRVAEKHEEWIVPGVSYRVFFSIQNIGNASAPAGHDVALQVDSQFIEFKPVPVSLTPGATYTDNFTTLINLSGSNDSVVVIADINNEVDESEETNNRRGNTFAYPPAPDLSIINKYEKWVQAGTQYTVNFTIRNNGNALAPSGHSAALSVDGMEIERKEIIISLAPGQSYSDVFNVTANLTSGMDKVKVTADINNTVIESNETNNAYENTIAWPPAPDLVINNKLEQWLPDSTTRYNVSFGVKNIGNAPAPAGHDVQLVVENVIVGTVLIPVILNQGSSYTGVFSANITMGGGSDNITVTADINNEVAESDESNNSRSNTWPASGAGVQVAIGAPAKVAPDRDFTAFVKIGQVQSLDAANYDVSFNPTVLRLDNVTSGNIGGVTVPVGGWNQREPGRFTIVGNIPGLTGASGNGSLAVLHFHVIGSLGQSSNITLSGGVLSSIEATEIPATWLGDFVEVSVIPGDANGDGLVNAVDITKVEREIAGLDSPTPGADANQDGFINAVDITKVERLIAGLDLT